MILCNFPYTFYFHTTIGGGPVARQKWYLFGLRKIVKIFFRILIILECRIKVGIKSSVCAKFERCSSKNGRDTAILVFRFFRFLAFKRSLWPQKWSNIIILCTKLLEIYMTSTIGNNFSNFGVNNTFIIKKCLEISQKTVKIWIFLDNYLQIPL